MVQWCGVINIAILVSCCTVCMCVGVPISRPVAGVACGLVTSIDPDTQQILDYKILTDIAVRYSYSIRHTMTVVEY